MKKATIIWALVLLISLLQKDFFDLCGGGGGLTFWHGYNTLRNQIVLDSVRKHIFTCGVKIINLKM